MSICKAGRARCWRIIGGTVGMRSPVCIYCGSPNPKPLADWEWAEVTDWYDHLRPGQGSKHVWAALAEHQKGEET
jgi:hypothetical protein